MLPPRAATRPAPAARTYVVVRSNAALARDGAAPLGTVVAPSRHHARRTAVARWPGPGVRVWRASACPVAWLIAALARDGTAARRDGD